MPPKKKEGPSKKTQEKKKTKAVEDKTFGLKNKKGAKQQKFVEQVNKQASAKFGDKGKEREMQGKKDAKAARAAYLAELDTILQPIKTERKVIMSKRQEDDDKDKKVTYLTIEELVEVERLKLKNSNKKLTPVTLESFLIWKTKKKADERKKAEEEKKRNQKYAKEGKIITTSGKQLFAYYHDKVDLNDDEEAADLVYDSDEEERNENLKNQGGFREITAETFYYEGVDAAINEELFNEDIDESLFDDVDGLAEELEGLE